LFVSPLLMIFSAANISSAINVPVVLIPLRLLRENHSILRPSLRRPLVPASSFASSFVNWADRKSNLGQSGAVEAAASAAAATC
jgi:hypothetical protein